MMKTRHVDCPRSAIIVFRFVFRIFGEVSQKASYADSRTLCGLACAPRTSLTPGCPVESQPPLMPRPVMVLSIYFRFVPFIRWQHIVRCIRAIRRQDWRSDNPSCPSFPDTHPHYPSFHVICQYYIKKTTVSAAVLL